MIIICTADIIINDVKILEQQKGTTVTMPK